MKPDVSSHWQLDPEIDFLNHGSFGACPTSVLEVQKDLRQRLEREPVAFFMRDYRPMLDETRQALAQFIGADPQDLVFIQNATAGVNAVVRSLSFTPGDELLTTNHTYNACRNALEYAAAQWGAKVVVAPCPFPLNDPEEIVTAIEQHITERTRLALFDHITSPTGLVLPVERLLALFHERGIDTLVDGAHALGMMDLDIGRLKPTYYTGNCHKWLCAPKGAAFLYVARERQPEIHPLIVSHGANSPRTDSSRFLLEFDWPGTMDPTPWLAVPEAIRFMGSLFDDGWAGLRRHNRELVLYGRERLCTTLGVPIPSPESMIGSLATVPLPSGAADTGPDPQRVDPLQDTLFYQKKIEVPVVNWPCSPSRMVRISAQAYNHPAQYDRLAEVLKSLLG